MDLKDVASVLKIKVLARKLTKTSLWMISFGLVIGINSLRCKVQDYYLQCVRYQNG